MKLLKDMGKTSENKVVKRLIRLPKSVDKALKRRADNNCITINSQVVTILRSSLGILEE